MSEKKRKTVSLDEWVFDELQDHPNASQLVNSLAAEYVSLGQSRDAALNQRIAEKESELEQARRERARIESKIDRLEREVNQLRDRLGSLNDEESQEVNAVVGLIQEGAFDREDLNVGNELVENRAANAGMTQDEFIDYVTDRL